MTDQTPETDARPWALAHPDSPPGTPWYAALFVPPAEPAQPRHFGIVADPIPEQWQDVLLFARRVDAERAAQAFLPPAIAWRSEQVEAPR